MLVTAASIQEVAVVEVDVLGGTAVVNSAGTVAAQSTRTGRLKFSTLTACRVLRLARGRAPERSILSQ